MPILTDPYSKAPAILLMGKTGEKPLRPDPKEKHIKNDLIGAGKSTFSNMLFEEEEKFKTSDNAKSCTRICQSSLLKLGNKEYNVVDTPGFFDTEIPDDDVMDEIAQSIVQCSHGIMAILYIMESGRYTKEQQITTEKILKFLGEESCRHLIVVFTKCTKKQTIERSKMKESLNNDNIKWLLDKVENRWIISPNLDIFEPDGPVVKDHMNNLKNWLKLMPKPYTTALFEEVRIAREKELKEIEEREKKEKLNLQEEKRRAGTSTAARAQSSDSCFSLHSKVILADGKRKEMSQLRIGDKVCCGEKNGKLIFSEIYAIAHADDQIATQYQKIDYLRADGTEGSLRLTPRHHIFVSQGKTVFAEDVRASVTELLLLDGEKLTPVIPRRVTKEWELGYISPFTQNGKIIVDEIMCSCYGDVPPYQEIINFAMVPFQLYSRITPISPVAGFKKEIHPYLQYLRRGQWILEYIDHFKTIIKGS